MARAPSFYFWEPKGHVFDVHVIYTKYMYTQTYIVQLFVPTCAMDFHALDCKNICIQWPSCWHFSDFSSMKRLGVFLPCGWNTSPLQGYPSIQFVGTHLYSWVERGTVTVKPLAQECTCNTVSPASALDVDASTSKMRLATIPPCIGL